VSFAIRGVATSGVPAEMVSSYPSAPNASTARVAVGASFLVNLPWLTTDPQNDPQK